LPSANPFGHFPSGSNPKRLKPSFRITAVSATLAGLRASILLLLSGCVPFGGEGKEGLYGRTCRLSEISHRSKGRTGRVLVVRLRPIKEPAVLRRLAQRNWISAEKGANQCRENRGLVRLQAYRRHAVLRWDTQHTEMMGLL
jgi:hypothetical protein